MRKKVNVLLLFALVVLSMVGCNYTQNASIATTPIVGNQSSELTFKPKGEYNMPGFGDEFFIYRFDNPNSDIVVYQISDCIYLLGDDSGESGTSYTNMVMEDSQFIALSNKYLLFMNEDGKVAVDIVEKGNVLVGENILKKYSYNDLSDEEKADFVYPIAYEKVIQ